MEILFAFENTTDAITAEQVLLSGGLPVTVMPLPGSIRAGCGICLRLPSAQISSARAALAAKNIHQYRLYTRTTSGGGSQYAPYQEEC